MIDQQQLLVTLNRVTTLHSRYRPQSLVSSIQKARTQHVINEC